MATPVPMLDEALFTAIAARLERLLELEVDERDDILTSARDDGTVDRVWFVFHMQMVTSDHFSASLEAIHQLHRLAESVSSSNIETEALWRRVLDSKMMLSPQAAGKSVLQRFARHVGPQQIQFLINYSGIQSVPLLKTFMLRQRAPNSRRMVVGLRISKTRLSPQVVDAIHGILPISHDEMMAVTLERLDIHDVGLSPPTLHALARLLDQRPVQELRLVNVLGRGALDDSVAGLLGVLHRVFSPTVTSIRTPIRLSLASNSLDSEYIDALAVEVENGTRRLAALDIANSISTQDPTKRRESWASLARLMLTHSHSDTPCELDLSNNGLTLSDVESFDCVLTDLVSTRLTHIKRALADGVSVSCRIKPTSTKPPIIDTTCEFPIHSIDPARQEFCVRTSPHELTWLSPESIKSLHCERPECALVNRFNAITLGSGTRRPTTGAVEAWLATVGADLQRLSLRGATNIQFTLSLLPRLCPRLAYLDIDVCGLRDAHALSGVLRSSRATLVSISAAGNLLDATAVDDLRRERTGLALCRLALQRNRIGVAGVAYVDTRLRESTTLQAMELDDATSKDLGGAYAKEQSRLSACHDGRVISVAPLPLNARLAFLLATRNSQALDAALLSLVFDYAAHVAVRSIIW